MLLFDQKRSVCSLAPGSFPASCEHVRGDLSLGYSQLLIRPDHTPPPPHIADTRVLTGDFSFFMYVLVPEAFGFLPTEFSAAVLAGETTRPKAVLTCDGEHG